MKTKLLLLMICAVLMFTACTDEKNARRILEAQGYTAIKITGYDAFECSEDDTYSTGFQALSPAGIPVTGVVCSGITKSATIRIK